MSARKGPAIFGAVLGGILFSWMFLFKVISRLAARCGLACRRPLVRTVAVGLLAMQKLGVRPAWGKAKGLVTAGVYGVMRHPVYLASFSSLLAGRPAGAPSTACCLPPSWPFPTQR